MGITDSQYVADNRAQYQEAENIDALIEQARKDMERAAKSLDFMAAARYRDRMYELQEIRKASHEAKEYLQTPKR